ncbi:ABC transporter permease [Enterococcus sp. BWM-S5]|uniref:ABC transporter permease n=1 Tax=Enterococcus larvae TaxID=2794352 RepID=A0ABS4CLB7_9ENTE|nr:FtsX-like permease family protein [Enterococcus larvae]MBP1047240.1 ABC transporter permease [Enterococcus larvae]
MISIETAVKAIIKNGRRSFLTIIGIVVGIAAVITIVTVGRGYERYSVKQILDSDDSKNNTTVISFYPLDTSFNDSNLDYYSEQDLALISTIEGVSKIEYETENPDETYKNKEVVINNTSENKKILLINRDGRKVIHGEKLVTADLGNKIVVISSKLANELANDNYSVAEMVGQTIEIAGEVFVIKGIYEADVTESTHIEMNKGTYLNYYHTSEKRNVQITVPNQYSLSDVADKAVKLLTSRGSMKALGKYNYSSSTALTDVLSNTLQMLTIIISFIGGISLFISGVGVMNMVYTSISERTKEIGIRRALGATARAIQLQFLLEGLILTVFGGIIGYLFGIFFAYIISWMMQFEFSIDLFVAGLAMGISILVGIIFSYIPSRNASKRDVVDLVR